MNLKQKIARRAAAVTELQTAANAGDMDTVRALNTEIATLNEEITVLEEANRAIETAQQTAPVAPAPVATEQTRVQTAGELVARSATFQGYAGFGRTERVIVTHTRALGADDVSTGTVAPLETPRRSATVATLERPLRIRDLMDGQTTDTYAGEYAVEVEHPNAASFVVEGDVKPIQKFEWELRNSNLKTVAVGAVITRQAAASPARVAGTINGRLAYNLEDEVDDVLLNGDGVNKPLGLYNLVGRNILAAPAGTRGDGAKVITAIRKGLTVSRTRGRAPVTGIVMSPVTWETIELTRAQGDTGVFIVTPNLRDGDGNGRIWGKTVVETEANTDSKVLLGAFNQSTVWDRGNIAYYASDSHDKFFFENKVALLAEEEIAPEHYRPSVYTEVGLTA